MKHGATEDQGGHGKALRKETHLLMTENLMVQCSKLTHQSQLG